MNEGVVRTLPIRLPCLPGEALDSWFEALARRLDSPLGDVLRHFGLPARSGRGDHLRGIPPDWTILLDKKQTAAIAQASGLDEQTITGMTLAHYDGRALRFNFERRYINRRVLWGRGGGSRFCPDCLKDNLGRWQLSWRLGWSFACPRHGRLLADCCPACGRIPRQRPRSGRAVPDPGVCASPPLSQGGRFSRGCGFHLSQTRTLRLPASHPALAAQSRLMDVIHEGIAAFGAYAGSQQSAGQALTDVRAIAGRVLADLPEPVIRDLVPPDLADAHLTLQSGSRPARLAADRPGFMAPPGAASAAVAVTIGLRVLEQNDIHQAGSVLRDLIDAMRDERWQISVTSIDDWGRDLSLVLKSVHLAALAPSLRPSEQLRYRTPAAMPRRPTKTDRDIARRARKIPSMFWPAWTTRLTPFEGVYPRVLAPVLAASLLIIDSKTSLQDAARRLGAITAGTNVSRILQRLDDQPQWPDMVAALVRLADHLDAADVPIDYQRRRRLDYSRLLPHEHWLRICRQTGTSPGSERRELIVRSLLFQRISGLPAEATPGHRNFDEAAFRAQSLHFAALQTPELARELTREAEAFLAEHSIHNEPVTWHPPTALMDDLGLPGPDPSRIDIPRLHQLVRQRKNPVRHAAQALGTSIEAVRQVLDEQPAPTLSPSKAVVRATGHVRYKARQQVPKATFARLYLDEHRSLQQISALTGFSRRVLTDLAREYDIPLRDGPQDYKRRGVVHRDWLIEQYVHRRRTLHDLAREKGMSPSNMIRWARTHDIPLRPRGGGSHDIALRVPDRAAQMPAILQKALTSPFALQRLDRFLAATAHPTLREAAETLGINQSTLVTQINRLERDFGRPLFQRAERGCPMKLTRFGRKVSTAIQELRLREPTARR
ncbi:TniQ family protein [Streptomyces pseudogriseolus]|uniref:TniQ family protein n=1 Tax=Streptomyces pseudogriseolus TaxID=36817 RepID=UPI003FA22B97